MKFYLDTANVEEIKEAVELNIIKGITTNPAILNKYNMDEKSLIESLNNINVGELFFQLNGLNMDERLSYFQKIKPLFRHENIVIKIPMDYEGIKTIAYFNKNYPNYKILATVIYSATQAIIACQLGCSYIAPYYNRMLMEGINANATISEIRRYIDLHNSETKIIAASFKSTSQIKDALINGSHTATITLDSLKQMVDIKSTNIDVNNFNSIKSFGYLR